MKKFVLLVATVLLCGSFASAQGILRRLEDRARNAVENNIGNKVEKGVNDLLDGASEKAKDKKKDKKKNKNKDNEDAVDGWTCPDCGAEGNTGAFCDDCGAKKPSAGASVNAPAASQDGWTCPSCGTRGNQGKFCNECGAKKPDGSAAAGWTCPECGKTGNTGKFCDDCGAAKAGQGATMTWNNYDFVAGDEIIFEDTMEGEQLGEFPSMWDSFHGNAEIAKIGNDKCINFQDAVITPLFNDGKPYLTEQFTVEFDQYFFHEKIWEEQNGTDLHGWAHVRLNFMGTDKVGQDYQDSVFDLSICCQSDEDRNKMTFDTDANYYWKVGSDGRNGKYDLRNVEVGKWHHIAISFNKRALKVYFDEQRIINIPNMDAPKWMTIRTYSDAPRTHFVKNVRIAKGAVPLYDRLASDGKIVTYAITFDTGKATIKPESTGEINRITDIMKNDPSIKFEIQGHCDSTGSAAVNDKLSQQRAEAILEALVANGISRDRLTAVGKGSNVPIADNSTDEGRAKNRRVEFVKK